MTRMARRLVLILMAVALCTSVAWAAVQQIRIVDSHANVIVGATVKFYAHGASQVPGNVIATGVTDVEGYVQPPPDLTPGTQYDFTTTDARVPQGTFTAVAPTQVTLVAVPFPRSGSVNGVAADASVGTAISFTPSCSTSLTQIQVQIRISSGPPVYFMIPYTTGESLSGFTVWVTGGPPGSTANVYWSAVCS